MGPENSKYCEKHKRWYPVEDKVILPQSDNSLVFKVGECPECAAEPELLPSEMATDRSIEFLQSCNIEAEYYNAKMSNFETPTKELENAKAVCMEMISTRQGKILMLGFNGTGKTRLACSMLREIGGKIMTMFEISATIRESYSPLAKRTELSMLDEWSRVPLFVIDEIGRTKGSDTEENWLSYIINKRHERKLPLILISNKHMRKMCPEEKGCKDCLENYLGNDILSRLSEGGIRLQFTGEDFRRRGRI